MLYFVQLFFIDKQFTMYSPFPPEKSERNKDVLPMTGREDLGYLQKQIDQLTARLIQIEQLKHRAEIWMQTDIRPKYLEFHPIENQTIFNINEIVSRPELSSFYLNESRQIYGEDYVINGSVLTWLGSELDIEDSLVLMYY